MYLYINDHIREKLRLQCYHTVETRRELDTLRQSTTLEGEINGFFKFTQTQVTSSLELLPPMLAATSSDNIYN